MKIWIFLAIATLIRIILSSLFPLTADESYYWLWTKHLSLSYVDHPPMVAYVNYLFTLGTENLFILRLSAVLITTLVSIILYFIAKDTFNEKIAFWSVVLFQILPHFVVVWLTQFVELPLSLFWIISIWLMVKIIREKKQIYWYILAITIGLGYLSKYTMFLFWPCLGLFFFIAPEQRFWLKRKEPYLAFVTSSLFFVPVLYWNGQHNWVSFTFHSGKVTGTAWGINTLTFLADQLVHFTPFLLFALYPVFRYCYKRNPMTKLLFSFSLPILLLFLLLSLKVKIWAHWPSIGYLAAIPLTVDYLIENRKSLKWFIAWISLFASLILIILFWVSPGILLHQRDYAKNFDLANTVPKEYKLFAKTNVSASLLEFYTKRQTYLATGFLKIGQPWGEKQYDIWGTPNLKRGETILYYGEDIQAFRDLANKYFEKVAEIPDIKLYLIEDYISNNYKMFKLERFRLYSPRTPHISHP